MDTKHTPDADQPLSGIRVLDLSRLLPGPYCTMLLARLGADVVKVETPLAGDYARMAPAELGFGGVFEAVNRGKRSIAVDYRKPAGRDLLLRLAGWADVFVESSRPGQLDRRGLGAVAVRAANPRIVYCSLSGFGQVGPYRDRPAHDVDYLAASGVLSLLAPAGSVPTPPGLQLADLSAGTMAATRILAALVARAATGNGAYIDAAVVDGPMAWLDTLGDRLAQAGTGPGPMSGAYPCYATYRTADGRWLAVGALELPFWTAFCRGLEREDLVSRQFDPSASAEVAAILAGRRSEELLARFDDDACVALVQLPAEAAADPDLRARGLPGRAGGAAPALGADTHDVLAEAGIAPACLERLRHDGVVTGRRSDERTARAVRLGAMLARMAERGKVPSGRSLGA